MQTSRREFLAAGAALLSTGGISVGAEAPPELKPIPLPIFERQLGITMSSAGRLEESEKISIVDWPKVLREELDMRILDLNSGVIETHDPTYLYQVREAAEKNDCLLTNMKINRADVDVGNADPEVRQAAVVECKRWIEACARLGVRWARPLPLKTKPDMKGFIDAYRELAQFGADRGVRLVVENYGWMDADPNAVPKLLDAVGMDVAAAPDTGNWADDKARYAGLAKMFPRAVTCDFKAGKLGPKGEHTAWDLKRCFDIGWDAGFRGPWCFEHANTSRKELFRELTLLRDMLRGWIAERDAVTKAAAAVDPFDGKTLGGWTAVDGKPVGEGWEVAGGVIHRKPGGRAGNIVTAREYGDFDLSFDWKIAAKGNSGVKYRVRSYGGSWLGLEYQIYDDAAVKKVKPVGSSGALYDLFEPNQDKALKPTGEYNTARIVVRDNRIEHWLNGKRIVSVTVGDAEWKRRISASKFADKFDFALNERGKLMLTDHGSEVWYRNFQMTTT